MSKSLTDKLLDYEMGDISEDDMLELFQELVDTGMAWSLQGSYGRMANYLIENEYIYDRRDS